MDDLRYRERPVGPNCYRTFTVMRGQSSDDQMDAFVLKVQQWCEDQFPPHPPGTDRLPLAKLRYRRLGWSIRIMNDTDAVAFKMRWC